MELISRFIKKPDHSFFLFGPRGTGESTWVGQSFPNALVLDMLDPEAFRSYSGRPERLRELVLGNPDKKQFVIDEVQKVPELLSVVHALTEEKRDLQFVGLWAIEIKNSRRIDSADLRALRAFKEDYPESRALLLYRGADRLKKHDVLCLPCDDFLRSLHPERVLPS